MHRLVVRGLAALTAASAMGLLAMPASAKPPTRVVDSTTEILCEAAAGDADVVVGVSRSDLAGTAARAEVAVDGETVGEGHTSSDWTGTSFRSTIPLTTRDGDPAGEILFSGSYQAASEPVTNESKFKAGNVHVVERHTETVLALSDVTLVYNGQILQPDRCDGWLTDGYLSYTNPKMRVERGSSLPYECTSTNAAGSPFIFSEAGVDELFVDLPLDDEPEIAASGVVAAGGGTWSGSLRVFESGEETGLVGATAVLARQRQTHSKDGDGTHFKVTSYAFTLLVAGGAAWAPTTVQCTLFSTDIKWHYPNQQG